MNRLRVLAALLLGLAALNLVGATAALAGGDINPARPVGGITLSAGIYAALMSTGIPIVTGILGRLAGGRTWAKKLIALVLAAVVGLLNTAVFAADGTAVISREAVGLALLAFAVQLAVYLGIYDESSVKLAAEGKR